VHLSKGLAVAGGPDGSRSVGTRSELARKRFGTRQESPTHVYQELTTKALLFSSVLAPYSALWRAAAPRG